MTSDFAERLRLLCERQSVRPIDLARALQVDKSAVSHWLSGQHRPSKRTPVEKIAAALRISVAEFYAADLLELRRASELRRAA